MANEVVIGAGFGDEGKGLMTDYYVSKATDNPIVVRYNASGQCTHTVVTPEGKRHIFKHIGAGAFHDAATYFSPHVVIHPNLYQQEMMDLMKVSVFAPYVYAHPDCNVTTPFDMMINQIVERHRTGRHGSCGFGFGETLQRSLDPKYRITFRQLKELGYVRIEERLKEIRDKYVPVRLAYLGISKLPKPFDEILYDNGIIRTYMKEIGFILGDIEMKDERFLWGYDGNITFEGGQGLMLCQDSPYFPHVTRSHTGLDNILEIVEKSGITPPDVTYMMRAYINKHGAGPLLDEDPDLQYEDNTNEENEWQGAPRYAPFHLRLFDEFIKNDFRKGGNLVGDKKINVTHFDQMPKFIQMNGVNEVNLPIHMSQEGFMIIVKGRMDADVAYVTDGPTRDNVKEWK